MPSDISVFQNIVDQIKNLPDGDALIKIVRANSNEPTLPLQYTGYEELVEGTKGDFLIHTAVNELGETYIDYYIVPEGMNVRSYGSVGKSVINTNLKPAQAVKPTIVEDPVTHETHVKMEGVKENGTGKVGATTAVNVPTALCVTGLCMELGDRITESYYENDPDHIPLVLKGNRDFKDFLNQEGVNLRDKIDDIIHSNKAYKPELLRDGYEYKNGELVSSDNGLPCLLLDEEDAKGVYINAETYAKLTRLAYGSLLLLNPFEKKYEDLTIPTQDRIYITWENRSQAFYQEGYKYIPDAPDSTLIAVKNASEQISVFAVSPTPYTGSHIYLDAVDWNGKPYYDRVTTININTPVTWNGQTGYYGLVTTYSTTDHTHANTIIPMREGVSLSRPTPQEVIGAIYGTRNLPNGVEEKPEDVHITDDSLKQILDPTTSLGAICGLLETDIPFLSDNKTEIPRVKVGTDGSVSVVNDTYYPLTIPQQLLMDGAMAYLDPYARPITTDQDQYTENPSLEDLLKGLVNFAVNINFDKPIIDQAPTDYPQPEPTPYPEGSPIPYPDPWSWEFPQGTTTPTQTKGDGSTEENKLPVATTGDTGLGGIYNPTTSELANINSFLWSSDFWDIIEKMINNPMEAIIGLQEIYFTPERSHNKEYVYCGCQNTHVQSYKVPTRFYTLNCGKINILEKYGNSYDYTDTFISIYLPYIGIVPLDTDLVMNTTIEVVYNLDVCSGAGLCNIYVYKDGRKNCLYSYGCQVSSVYPLSGRDFTGLVGSLTSLASSIITANPIGIGGSLISAVGNSKGDVQKSGGYGGNTGALGIKKPYVIIKRNIPTKPTNQESYEGLPTNIAARIGTMRGFTVCSDIKLNTTNMTQTDIENVTNLLQSGVIL